MRSDPTSREAAGAVAVLEEPVGEVLGVRRRRWSSILLGTVIFVSGAVVGGVAVRGLSPQRVPVRRADEIPARLAQGMQRRYRLSDAQRTRIEALLQDNQKNLRRLARRIAPEARTEFDRTMDEISALLTADQAEAWRKETAQRLEELFPWLRDDAPPAP